MDDDRIAQDRLLSLLRSRQAILLVGAGSSKLAGYPLWPELIEIMRHRLTPQLSKPDGADLPSFADVIRNQLISEDRLPEYHKFLDRQFTPQPSCKHQPFHQALIQLGFSGIVTTNYDLILEDAIGETCSSTAYFRCEPIDLCEPRRYRVLDFLRSIGPSNEHRYVLHLHGLYRSPDCLILTRRDYETRYGQLRNADGRRVALDTLHRKVIWTLLATHSVVFVGFSLQDEFFVDILELVNEDFQVFSDPVHFAIFGCESNADKEHIRRSLEPRGVAPVFYHIAGAGESRHSALEQMVFEFGTQVGVKVKAPPINELNKKMLDL